MAFTSDIGKASRKNVKAHSLRNDVRHVLGSTTAISASSPNVLMGPP